jgi:hypothetical protein
MELKEFLEKVVGTGSIIDDDGSYSVRPFEINHEGKYISFKGQRVQNYYSTDIAIVDSIVNGMNYGYSMALKNVIDSGSVSQSIKPFKFT